MVPVGTVACANANQLCEYPAGTECLCLSIVGNNQWICDSPRVSGDPRCAPIVPNAGTTCTTSGLTCSYACGLLNASAVTTVCGTQGLWQWLRIQPCVESGG